MVGYIQKGRQKDLYRFDRFGVSGLWARVISVSRFLVRVLVVLFLLEKD